MERAKSSKKVLIGKERTMSITLPDSMVKQIAKSLNIKDITRIPKTLVVATVSDKEMGLLGVNAISRDVISAIVTA